MAQVKRNFPGTQELAATKGRSFRTFLLVQQFAAQEIGERIARARNERGMTQEELAAIASFSKRSLQEYETGVRVPYRHLQELGKLLGRKTEWFLYGDADETATDDPAVLERLEAMAVAIGELGARIDRLVEQLGSPEEYDEQSTARAASSSR